MSDDDWWLGEPGTADVSKFSPENEGGGPVPARAVPSLDVRSSERYLVRWKMAVVFEGKEGRPTFHGRTHDLSLAGTGMLIDINLHKSNSPVIVLLAPPPLTRNQRPKLIEITSRQLDAVYSGANGCFRLGFAFLEFKNDALDYLKERLSHHKAVAFSKVTKEV